LKAGEDTPGENDGGGGLLVAIGCDGRATAVAGIPNGGRRPAVTGGVGTAAGPLGVATDGEITFDESVKKKKYNDKYSLCFTINGNGMDDVLQP